MTAAALSVAELQAAVGRAFGPGDWVSVTQENIDDFAQATGDRQWIHVDVEKARAGPFGATIAHGFLTLSLLPRFMQGLVDIHGGMTVNYGLDRVRFVSPVPVGSRLRARMLLRDCRPAERGGWQLAWDVTIEREGQDKPVCVAQSLMLHYPAEG